MNAHIPIQRLPDPRLYGPMSCAHGGLPIVLQRAGMGLVELLLSAAMIAVVLGGLILTSQSLRNETCEQQTRTTLRQLRSALRQYYDRHKAWPAGATAGAAMETLLSDPATASLVDSLAIRTDAHGQICVDDGYGRPIRYMVQSQGREAQADFVSAGRDGRFGDLTSQRQDLRTDAADNLYGSDLETPNP